jgi:hypothetical protein
MDKVLAENIRFVGACARFRFGRAMPSANNADAMHPRCGRGVAEGIRLDAFEINAKASAFISSGL